MICNDVDVAVQDYYYYRYPEYYGTATADRSSGPAEPSRKQVKRA
jgi:hypothetical protein